MGVVRKADFYYGSMLSCFINSGLKPAIFENGNDRRIYDITTNSGDYKIYAKYISVPSNINRKNKDKRLWHFSFLPEEVEYFKNYHENNKKLYLVLICGQEKLQDSEIAILTLSEAKKCLDVDYIRPSHRISIIWEKGSHGLKAYGTGIDGKENAIRISRDISSYFLEDMQ